MTNASQEASPTAGRALPWRRREAPLLVAALLFLSAVFVAVDAILLQQSYMYFGGGSLNKARALTQSWQYVIFFIEAFSYNVLFLATCGLAGIGMLARLTRLNAARRLLVVGAALGVIDAAAVALRYQLYAYFKDTFSFGVLKVLTAGDLRGMLNWISFDAVAAVVGAIFAAIAVVFIATRLRLPGKYQEWRAGRRTWLAFAAAWLLLGVNHFQLVTWDSMQYGLSGTVSYSSVNAVLAVLSDFDRDGYGPLTRPPDSNNWNASIYPYAVDIPGDGIDQDGLCGDLEAPDPAVRETSWRPLAQPNRKNVIVVVVETFRADVFGMTRRGREVMPFLNSLGRRYAATTAMYSNFGVTSRAIQTVLGGGLHSRSGDVFLLDYLRRYGYRTYAVSAQDESWGDTDQIVGFQRMTRAYDTRKKPWDLSKLSRYDRVHPSLPMMDSPEVNAVVAGMLDEAAGAPFAMYVNFQDTHYPYYAPQMELTFIDKPQTSASFFKAANREAILDQYANAANHLDKGIAGLFAELDRRKLLENTVVVIAGDHPDSIYENGVLGHAWTLDKSQRTTPFVVVNGRGEYATPMGQDEIAGLILNSLDGALNLPPTRFRDDPRKRIFELTGTLDAPRELGWIAPASLTTIDFRNWAYQPDVGRPWIKLGAMKPGAPYYSDFKALVNRWETERYLQWRQRPEQWGR